MITITPEDFQLTDQDLALLLEEDEVLCTPLDRKRLPVLPTRAARPAPRVEWHWDWRYTRKCRPLYAHVTWRGRTRLYIIHQRIALRPGDSLTIAARLKGFG